MDMGEKENIAPCQKYVGWADIESVEYKYPPRNAVKYVLRITLVGSSPRVWREIAVPYQTDFAGPCHNSCHGWEESHLSMFQKGRNEYPSPPLILQ